MDDFGDLWREHSNGVFAFFVRRTFDAEASLDLVAETFARAVELRRRAPADGDERAAWIYGIARRLLLTYWRKGRVERRALARLGVEPPALSEESLRRVEDLAGVDVLRDLVRSELRRLPEGQRAALQLRLVDELPYPEVAARLGISEANARARVSRATRALHRRIAEASA